MSIDWYSPEVSTGYHRVRYRQWEAQKLNENNFKYAN